MPNIRSFAALRPAPEYVEDVHIYHGDAGDEARSRARANTHPNSILNVSRTDLLLDSELAKDENFVRKESRKKLQEFLDRGVLIRDEKESIYIYRLSMANHSQTGIVACADVRDYIEGNIKRHELTRADKIHIQEKLIKRIGGNMEPVLLVYDSEEEGAKKLSKALETWTISHDSTYDFFDAGGIRHELWVVEDDAFIECVSNQFENFESLYICDGHHRIAASAEYYVANVDKLADGSTDEAREARRKVRAERSQFFMASIFPSSEMLILDYNRAVKDLHGLSEEDFFRKLEDAGFDVKDIGVEPAYPEHHGEYTMVMNDRWYRLTYIKERDMTDPVAGLDVSLLQNVVLRDILGIKDPQHDSRITFISGNKGLGALQNSTKADEGDMKVAFAISPPDMQDIMRVSDTGLTMPPKSTFFEPKLVSGLLIYEI